MRLTIVGCSGSFAGPESPASSYLLEAEDGDGRTWRIVLDLGSGALGALQRFASPSALDAVLISHLHPDHFIDLCGLYVARRYDPHLDPTDPPAPLPVYGPVGTAERVLAAYGPDAATELPSVYDVRPFTDGGVVQVGPFTITSRTVNHPVPAFGLRVEHDGVVVAYSGDTDSCSNLVALARDADLFLCEASFVEGRDEGRDVHLTGKRAGEAATEADARRLVLTHIPVWTDTDTVVDEARRAYLGPVEAARSGASYVLERVEAR
ncbi:metal-dependent hydrolase [Kineosporia sp. NBRC 101677]|uniref:MBL fold metallo-hydrolase n=1 Tax=Kineosporia sp. NBRC 101677 TaxID=3032197 RepID=UPI0024A112C4|nr:MBL fold metallo-hydrolase [Kineosporia sp. NBRC 101677]GLY19332.1 metal-dependent hydrolase [Kineosporia sp. NBRC 101677]